MSNEKYTDDKLNLFIDEELDFDEIDGIHQAVLKDAELSARVCQLKAVRELVRYAYESTPVNEDVENSPTGTKNKYFWKSIAASMLLVVGATTGWFTKDYAHSGNIVSAYEVFDYFKYKAAIDRTERKIVVHVTTGDVLAANQTLNEVEQLLASYAAAKVPMQLDIVTFRDGINMLRVDGSPYINRIEKLLDSNENVAIYACQNSIKKANKKWGKEIALMPQAVTTKTAKELISERLKEGWVYIKV